MSYQDDNQNKSAAQVVDDNDDEDYKKEGFCTKLCSKIFGGKGDIQTVVDPKDLDNSNAIKIIVLGPGYFLVPLTFYPFYRAFYKDLQILLQNRQQWKEHSSQADENYSWH